MNTNAIGLPTLRGEGGGESLDFSLIHRVTVHTILSTLSTIPLGCHSVYKYDDINKTNVQKVRLKKTKSFLN